MHNGARSTEASRQPQLSVAPATTSLSVYTVIEAYKQTDSTILHLFTYLPHNLFYFSL